MKKGYVGLRVAFAGLRPAEPVNSAVVFSGWEDGRQPGAGAAALQWCAGRHQNLQAGIPEPHPVPRVQAEVRCSASLWPLEGAAVHDAVIVTESIETKVALKLKREDRM